MRSRPSGFESRQCFLRSPSPRYPRGGTEEQGMTGDANGDQETWSDKQIYRNSQISDSFKIPLLGDWGSRDPGSNPGSPTQTPAARLESAGQRPCLSATWRRRLAIPAKSTRATELGARSPHTRGSFVVLLMCIDDGGPRGRAGGHGDSARETGEVGDDVGVPTKGVLFDWRGTLVNDPDDAWWVRTALERIERRMDDAGVAELVDRLRQARELPSVVSAHARADCAAEQHRAATMLWFSEANLDSALAEALYTLDLDPVAHPFFQDVPETFERLRTLGIKIAIVSDIHFDFRREFALLGIDGLVNAYILSFEHGVQKPDPRIFMLALDHLDLSASEALMVGDRPERDGGAVHAGIRTLLLPQEDGPRRGLRSVLAMLHQT